jgi:N-methylhydantoinase A
MATLGANREALCSSFHDLHKRNYTFALERHEVEIVNFRTITHADTETPTPTLRNSVFDPSCDSPVLGARSFYLEGRPVQATILARARLPAGYQVEGPAIVEEASATTVILAGQRLEVDGFGNLRISRTNGVASSA